MCNAGRSCGSGERGERGGRIRVTNMFSTSVSRPPPSRSPGGQGRFAPPPPTYGCQADANRLRNRTFGGYRDRYSPAPQRYAYSYPGPSAEPRGGPANIQGQFTAFGQHLGDYFGHESTVGRRGYEDRLAMDQVSEPVATPPKPPKKESLIEWFDRTVEAELEKRREPYMSGAGIAMVDPVSFTAPKSGRKHLHPLIVESSVSGLDINARLRSEQDTELILAVDKLAKAQAMVAFEGAVRAAEEAAAKAPPELAEEAATAGVREFHKEITSVVHQTLPGIKPIEVIGYVGITRPKKPKGCGG